MNSLFEYGMLFGIAVISALWVRFFLSLLDLLIR